MKQLINRHLMKQLVSRAILCIIFLTSAVFVLIASPPYSNSGGFGAGAFLDWDISYFLDIILTFIVIAILAFFFAYSTYVTERKIKNNTYSTTWLIGFSLIAGLVFYVGVSLSSLLFWGGEVFVFAILYSWMAALAFAFFFLFLPSLFIFLITKKGEGARILKMIKYIVIVLFILSSIFFVAKLVTCAGYVEYGCMARIALMTNNPAICEKSKYDTFEGLCYAYIAKLSDWDSADICYRIPKSAWYAKNDCLYYVGVNSQDFSVCREMRDEKGEFLYNMDGIEVCKNLIREGIKR